MPAYPRRSPTTHTAVVSDEVCVYDWSCHRVHALNPTAAQVWQWCDGQTDIAEMADRLRTECGVLNAVVLVELALSQFRERHLLDDPVGLPSISPTMSRRELARRGVAVALLPAVASILAPTPLQAQSTPSGSITFGFTGAPQTFLVPPGVRTLRVSATGAAGGWPLGLPGGFAAIVAATIAVIPGETLTVTVGGQGLTSGAGGFNGGGAGYTGGAGGGGGGASDIRQGGTSLTNRVIVAGGGGGPATLFALAGSGGVPIGSPGRSTATGGRGGGGGTLTAGGAGGAAEQGLIGSGFDGSVGALGVGGAGGAGGGLGPGGTLVEGGGGGGGGFFGGGGGGSGDPLAFDPVGGTVHGGAGGGGGSSFAGPAATAVSYALYTARSTHGEVTLSW